MINTVFSAPSFKHIGTDNGNPLWYSKSFWTIKNNKSLADNIYALFFPSSSWNWWIIFSKIRTIAVWLAFVFFIRAGALFVLNANDDWELKKAKLNLLYLFYWAFLIFGSVWLLWSILWVWSSDTNATNMIVATQYGVIWKILLFFKSFAYYFAIMLMVYYWFKIMQAQEKEDKIKSAKSWALNIILSLIAIKVLDYIYYIAQKSDFAEKWTSFIAGFWKVLGWLLWVVIILALIYSASLLITSRWNEESWKKAKTIIRNVFLVIFVIFLFIVIVFDLVRNFS